MNIAIITGASSGIGREFVRQMDPVFHSIDEFWLNARRGERLWELKEICDHPVRNLTMDLLNEDMLDKLEITLVAENPCIKMLINAAGFGIMGPVAKLDIEEQLEMVSLNCQVLTRLTHMCLPYMDRNSRILQMASVAAFLPQPNFSVYAATKSYVLSFSRALAREVKKREIYVTAVCPGPVDTEFFKIAERFGTALSIKKLFMVTPKKVVEQALRDSYYKKEVSVIGLSMKLFYGITKLIPHSLILSIMEKM